MPLEQRIATYMTRIGVGALLLAMLYFYKYAVDNAWIGPTGRVLSGAIVGVGILAAAERIRARTRASFVHALLGLGLAFLFITAYASSAFYHLVDAAPAFAANAVILLLGAALAWRHRAQAVLVLVLVATFANPVMLSTGADRPLALFSYLLVMTSVVNLVALKLRFRLALALSIAGVVVLFAGWYQRFFDVSDHRNEPWASELPPERQVGAYLLLSARVVPLGAIAAFTAEWLAIAFALRRERVLPRTSAAVALAGLVLSHAGGAALLYDHPSLLGVLLIGLAALAVLSLRRLEATRLLLLPMLAAFAILVALVPQAGTAHQLPFLALLSLWSAVYVIAFLHHAGSDAERAPSAPISAGDALRAATAVLAFGILAMILLLPAGRFALLALVVAAGSALLAYIADRARLAWLTTATLALTFLPLIGSADDAAAREIPWAFLGISLAWALIYAGAAIRAAIDGTNDGPLGLLTTSLPMLGYLALAIAATPDRAPTLRALLTALAGGVDLGLAALIARRRPDLPGWRAALAAEALGLFAAAIGFGLSGASITVVWAILVAVAGYNLAQSRARAWAATVIALATLVLVRLFAFDIPAADAMVELFERTDGRSGVLQVPLLFNPRAVALAGASAAFLVAAATLARAGRRSERAETPSSGRGLLQLGGALAVVGYALVISMAVLEIRTAVLSLPSPPEPPLDGREFQMFLETVHKARAEQHNVLEMTTTVVLAISALAFLAGGFLSRDAFHRYYGLAVLVSTLGKLLLWDVWNLQRIHQVIVLGVVGAIALASGFLYARIRSLFRAGGAAILLLAPLALPATARAGAPPPEAPEVAITRFKTRALVDGIAKPGDYRIPATAELYARSLTPGALDDLRIAGPDGGEVPYVVRLPGAERHAERVTGRILDPGAIEGGGFRAGFELPERREHCDVELALIGGYAYLRRVRIETGERPGDLQTIADGALVYAISAGGQRAENRRVPYPRSAARYVRVTILPDPGGEIIRITGATFGCVPPRAREATDRVPLAITAVTRDPTARTTQIELDAGTSGLPVDSLHLRVSTPEFVRRVDVRASSSRSFWPPVGAGVIYRVAGRDGEGPEWTAIPIQAERKRWIQLVIQDGDDAPLEVSAVEGAFPAREIVLRARSAGPHVLYVGDPTGALRAPSYELAQIIARKPDGFPTTPAQIGALEDNPDFGTEPKIDGRPFTERFRGPIGAVLAVVVVGLGLWAVRLIRREGPGSA